ncbi:DMT family transporter [Candidatus Bealeia paramacronuclearis]|uniref:DMT family transporter n=1 Tax=Candidatus Bealeia paramacronuclearis TaxID=1921001 RepID=A0ABZ2C305_9PROT|nr:DMT family transporter [Candidatus Bealeia paramacronuclearis]
MSGLAAFWENSPHFRGAFWKVLSFVSFSGINGIVRYLSQSSVGEPLPPYEVAFFQNLFGLIFLVPWILKNGPKSLKTQRPGIHASRIALSALGIILWYSALAFMPLSQAVGLMFLGPLLTALGAGFFLRERIGIERGIAIAIGFLGGALISHGLSLSLGLDTFYKDINILLPISAAACFSGATLMVRTLGQHDSSQLIVTYLLLFIAPLLLIPTLWGGFWPESWQWPWLLFMGGLAALAHLSLSNAYKAAEVSYLIPYGFTKWFASSLIGYLVFSEIPGFWTVAGAFIIMGAIVFLSHIELKRRKRLEV